MVLFIFHEHIHHIHNCNTKGELPMAKKLGRFALFGALAGAAAAGAYYYLQKKNAAPADDFDDYDDFDDFDEDLDDDFFDDSTGSKARPHIPIDLDNAKEIIGEKVIETLDKTKEKLEQLNVPEKIDKAKEIISDRMSPAAPVETEYTEMDMSGSSSAAYSDAGTADNSETASATEEFFDDSGNS